MTNSATVQVRILDKEYQVQCPPEEKAGLLLSAQAVDERMREARKSGNIIGLERTAVMVALNLAYDLLKAQAHASEHQATQNDLSRIDHKLTDALKALNVN